MKHCTHTGGYTLIEAVISVVIFSMAALMIVGTITFLYKANSNAIEQAFALASARRGVDKMIRDIREAAYSDEGGFPIESIDDYSFTFYSDTDRDLYVERVRYFLDGTDLKKGTLDPSGDPLTYNAGAEVVSMVADNIRNEEQGFPIFNYFDDQGNQIATTSSVLDIAFVNVNVIVNVNPLRLPEEFTLRSSATIRNLKTNL